MTSRLSLPIISLLDEGAVLDPRAVSCGAFLVELPPQQNAAVSRTYAAADTFFSLEESKRRVFDARANGTVRGWTKASSSAADIAADHHRDYEAFDVALPRFMDPPHDVARRLFDQNNRWPDSEFQSASEEFIRDVGVPIECSVWSLIQRSAGLEDNYFEKFCADSGLRYLRHLTYPPALAHGESFGFYPHRDFEAFTVHLEDAPGLEVQDPDTGGWIPIRHGGRYCTVLIGQVGELLCPDVLKAALHRVRVEPSANRRHAIAYFSAPSFDTPIADTDYISQTGVVSVGEYLTLRFMKSFGLTH